MNVAERHSSASLEIKYTDFFAMHFHFDDETQAECMIFGDDSKHILETALFLASLEVSAQRKMTKVTIRLDLNLNASHSEQLALLLDATATKTIIFDGVDLNSVLSTVIATRPYPIDLTLSSSCMDYQTFTGHLEGRTVPFGSLVFTNVDHNEDDTRPLFDHLNVFTSLHVDLLAHDLILKLLATPMKSVAFTFCAHNDDEMDLTTVDIVSKDIRIDVIYDESTFLQSFLHRVGQLGHLESLQLILFGEEPVPGDAINALIHAVDGNKKLRNLEWNDQASGRAASIKGLLAALENHQEMRTLRISQYPDRLDPTFVWLKRLLKRNRHIQVTDTSEKILILDDEVDSIYKLNRFFRGSERLKKESTAIRSLFVGAALTHSGACDFQRGGLLLTDHLDTVCELLHENESNGEAEDVRMEADVKDGEFVPTAASVASIERSNGQKRKRATY